MPSLLFILLTILLSTPGASSDDTLGIHLVQRSDLSAIQEEEGSEGGTPFDGTHPSEFWYWNDQPTTSAPGAQYATTTLSSETFTSFPGMPVLKASPSTTYSMEASNLSSEASSPHSVPGTSWIDQHFHTAPTRHDLLTSSTWSDVSTHTTVPDTGTGSVSDSSTGVSSATWGSNAPTEVSTTSRATINESTTDSAVSSYSVSPAPTTVQAPGSKGVSSESSFQPIDWIASSQIQALLSLRDTLGVQEGLLPDWFPLTNTSDYCSITGVVCDINGFVTSLQLNNLGLSGSLPDVFDYLPQLNKVLLQNNEISGVLPSSLLDLLDLRMLNIAQNYFHGQLPDLVAPSLRRLIVNQNNFHGTIPQSLCSKRELASLDLSGNDKMTGSLPSCLGGLPELNLLKVTDLGLTGTVPASLCDVSREMNGLTPNIFGCNAVACSPGTFQPFGGRQRSEETECEICDIPSNVIGATRCRWVEALVPDLSPSVSPSTGPSVLPTIEPTTSPSFDTGSDGTSSVPSILPSFVPSQLPSISGIPSAVPSRPGGMTSGINNEPQHKDKSSRPGILSGFILLTIAIALTILSILIVLKRRGGQGLEEAEESETSLQDVERGEISDVLVQTPKSSLYTIAEESLSQSKSQESSAMVEDSRNCSSPSTPREGILKIATAVEDEIAWPVERKVRFEDTRKPVMFEEPSDTNGWSDWIMNPFDNSGKPLCSSGTTLSMDEKDKPGSLRQNDGRAVRDDRSWIHGRGEERTVEI